MGLKAKGIANKVTYVKFETKNVPVCVADNIEKGYLYKSYGKYGSGFKPTRGRVSLFSNKKELVFQDENSRTISFPEFSEVVTITASRFVSGSWGDAFPWFLSRERQVRHILLAKAIIKPFKYDRKNVYHVFIFDSSEKRDACAKTIMELQGDNCVFVERPNPLLYVPSSYSAACHLVRIDNPDKRCRYAETVVISKISSEKDGITFTCSKNLDSASAPADYGRDPSNRNDLNNCYRLCYSQQTIAFKDIIAEDDGPADAGVELGQMMARINFENRKNNNNSCNHTRIEKIKKFLSCGEKVINYELDWNIDPEYEVTRFYVRKGAASKSKTAYYFIFPKSTGCADLLKKSCKGAKSTELWPISSPSQTRGQQDQSASSAPLPLDMTSVEYEQDQQSE